MALTEEDKRRLDAEGIKQVEKATADWNAAYKANDSAGMEAARKAAESARNAAGYYTDSSGRYAGETKSSGNGKSSGFKGSATGVYGYTKDQQEIIDRMNANSAEWWETTSEERRNELHAENEALAKELGGNVTYDPNTGRWSGEAHDPNHIEDGDDILKNTRDLIGGAQSELQKALKAQQEAQEAALKRTINDLNAKIPKAQQETADENAGAYSTYLKAVNPFGKNAQALLDQGLANSGFAESSRVNMANSYQSAVNKNQQTLRNYIREIELAKTDARLKGDYERANALAEYGKLMENLMNSNASTLGTLSMNILNSDRSYANSERSYNAQMEQSEYARLLDKAETLAKYGDFSGYLALGYTQAEVDRMAAAWKKAQEK